MRRRMLFSVSAFAFALGLGVVPTVFAAPAKGPIAAKPKPKPSVSASVEASASVTASATAIATTVAPTASASGVAPVSSIAISPLTPRPDEAPPVKGAASTKPSTSYEDLMSEVAALRARVAVVSNKIWTSKLGVTLRLSGSHARIAKATLSLDGAQVWAAPKGFTAEDDKPIFDGGVAPGLHSLTLEVERRDDRDETFRTIDRTTVTITVPQGKKLEVEARLEDDSNMGGDFPSDSSGKYDLRIKMKAKAK